MTREELDALVSKLAGESVSDVAKSLMSNANGVYQDIFNAGHKVADGKAAADKKKLEEDLEAEKKARASADATLEKIRGEQPDVAKIHEDYKAQIDDLKAKHRDEVQRERDARRDSERDRARSDLRTALISHHALDADYAEVLVAKPEVMERLRYDPQTGLQIMQKGKDIPMQPGDGQSATDLLATELAADAPAKFVNSRGDRGSGTKGSGQGGSTGAGFYDRLRERVKADREAAKPANKSPARERLGISQ